MQDIETTVRHCLARIVRSLNPTALDLAQSLKHDLGLSSLQLVLLISTSCKDTGVPMTSLVEQDLAAVHTGADLVYLLTAKQPK